VELGVPIEVARELGEPKCGDRVRDDVRVRRVRELLERPVAGEQLRAREARRRVLGMQLEREPGDLGVELAPEPVGQRLAEPAEGSDVVGPDEDLVFSHLRHSRRSSRGTAFSSWRAS
jgi:hypothetical protein